MPIYEYECKKCGQQTEVLQNFSDPEVTKCELCSGRMRKLMSQNTFHLKGAGWYVTDYASKQSDSPGKNGDSEEKATKKETKEAKGTTDKSKKEGSSTSKPKKEGSSTSSSSK